MGRHGNLPQVQQKEVSRVLLLQLDGKIPNLALMAIAAHHRARGDEVVLRHCRRVDSARSLFDGEPDKVYASAIFEKTRPVAEAVRRVYPQAVIGGTGWDLSVTLEKYGIDATSHDYTDYPDFKSSMGFTQRGCRLACEFCKVPLTEGKVRSVASVWELWRGGPYPRELLLLDNDFFGQPEWRRRICEMRDGGFKVSFNQGVNARMISEEAAEAIASVDYRADDMKRRCLYTAWDSKEDEDVLFRGLRRLVKAGVKPDHIMVYMLIGYWADETEDDWIYRQQRLREFGCRPYPMPYVRNHLTMGFQRWCVGAYDKRVPWPEWKAARCEPRDLKSRGRMALPLFDEEEDGDG